MPEIVPKPYRKYLRTVEELADGLYMCYFSYFATNTHSIVKTWRNFGFEVLFYGVRVEGAIQEEIRIKVVRS